MENMLNKKKHNRWNKNKSLKIKIINNIFYLRKEKRKNSNKYLKKDTQQITLTETKTTRKI